MAHQNIDERRLYISNAISDGKKLTFTFKREVSALFGCSHSAVDADWRVLARLEQVGLLALTPKIRAAVHMRDGDVCQYCGRTQGVMIIEHVLPAAWGGVTALHNLVVACATCNVQKGRSVWIPRNLDAITDGQPQWKEIIREHHARTKERHSGRRQAAQAGA